MLIVVLQEDLNVDRGRSGENFLFPDGTRGEQWREHFQIDLIHHNTSFKYRNTLQL